jgi:glycerol-1-phosphate dehydrogenase [NAD(P)+]
MTDYNGVISELVSGDWVSPVNNKRVELPIKQIEIALTLDGREAELIAKNHHKDRILLVCDEFTDEALGERVYSNIDGELSIAKYIWKKPFASIDGVEHIREVSRNYDSLIAVGSGTINDTVKYATFLDKKEYSVFATTPMNAYTAPTASISFDGIKKSLPAHAAKGVYFDLSVLSKCPKRLTAAAFADVICRTTSQVDWLMSNAILNTAYDETPYVLLSLYEDAMINSAAQIEKGDINALGMLTKVAAIVGLCTFFAGTTHFGSMAEHGISHFIDNFAKDRHPGTSHGEQVGIATMTISKIQNTILNADTPPLLKATEIPDKELLPLLGSEMLLDIKDQLKAKILDQGKTDQLNEYLSANWNEFVRPLRRIMITYDRLWNSMGKCGALRTPAEADMDKVVYQDAVRYSRYIRDRYTILDFAGDSHLLDSFVD